MTVTLEVEAQRIMASNGGSVLNFSQPISFLVNRETQEELYNLWENSPMEDSRPAILLYIQLFFQEIEFDYK